MTGISGLNQFYYGGQTTSSIGTLLGSLGTPTGVNSLSSVLTDYKSIQTGTYGGLLKAYYASQKEEAAKSSAKSSSKKDAVSSKIKDSLTDTRSKMESLKSSADKLSATGTNSLFNKKETKLEDGTKKSEYDVDSIYNAVSGFVSDYNKAVSSSKAASYKSVSKGADSLSATTDVMANSLKKIGIEKNSEGKLELSEETFRKADMEKVKEIFSGTSGYAANVSSTASRIAGTSSNKLSILSNSRYAYGKTGQYSAVDNSSLYDAFF